MAKEEADAPLGEWPGGRKRKERTPSKVALRVQEFLSDDAHRAVRAPGVQPLNAGFFVLERMRARTVATKKAAQGRAKVRGK